jgi:hypothetical protein
LDRNALTPVDKVLLVYRDDRNNIGGTKTELARYTTKADGTLQGTVNTKDLSTVAF